MKKIVLFFSFIFLFVFQSFSQDYNIKWGPSYKKEGGLFAFYQLIGMEGDYYYMLMRPRKSNTLLKFDMNHKLVSNRKLDMKYGKQNIVLERFVRTQNGTYGYMSVIDKKAKEWKIFATKFEGGNFVKPKEIYNHEFKTKVSILFGGFTAYNNYDNMNEVIESQDGSHVAFTNIVSTKDKKNEEENMAVALFDADLKLVWDKVQKFPYSDKKLVIDQTIVDNDGIIYLLARLIEKKNKKEKGLPQYSYKVFRVTKDNMTEFDIEIGKDVAPMDASLFFPDNTTSDFILAGFYTNNDRKSGMKGLFFASGNKETGVNNIKLNKFEDDFLEDLISKKRLEKDRGLRITYDIDDFFQYDDGSIGFLAEEDYVVSHTYTDSQGRMKTRYTYVTNSIIIPRFSKEGELLNIQKIKKSFSSGTPLETSYSIAFYNDKIYLMFNDSKNKEEAKEMKGKKRWRFTDLVVMNKNGEIEFNETLFNNKEIDLWFVTHLSDYFGDKMLIGTMNGKKYGFGILDLDGE